MSEGIALMKINHFRDMYVAELQELVSVESQLSDSLLRMAGAATHPALKDLLLHHGGKTEAQGDWQQCCESMALTQWHTPTRLCRPSSMKRGKCLAYSAETTSAMPA
jgi:ferritin-like metal-binding protein YciE